MKKYLSIALAIVMTLCAAAGFASETPAPTAGAVTSKTSSNVTQADAPVSEEGVPLEGLEVTVVQEEKEEVVAEITKIYTAVVTQQIAPVKYFPPKVQEDIAIMLPALLAKSLPITLPATQPGAETGTQPGTEPGTESGTTPAAEPEQAEVAAIIEKMEINEIITIEAAGYKEEMGSVKVSYTFATVYVPEQTLIALYGLYSGEKDENGEFAVEWMPVPASANADGKVEIQLTPEQMIRITNAKTVALAILSVPVEAA